MKTMLSSVNDSSCARVRGLRALVTIATFVPMSMLLGSAPAQAQGSAACPMPQQTQVGSWIKDYRVSRDALPTVERRHFTSRVELLISGESTSQPGPDIGYTLNKFPNHHRALNALSRLGERLQTLHVRDMHYSIDCYFQRAVGFQPDDTVARLLYAQHLGKQGRKPEAGTQLVLAARAAGDNPLTHFNIGLIAAELQDYPRALEHAHIAYGLDFPRPELRDLLKRQGQWVDPPSAAASAAAPGASGSAPAAPDPASAPR